MSDFTSNIFDHEESKKIVKRMRKRSRCHAQRRGYGPADQRVCQRTAQERASQALEQALAAQDISSHLGNAGPQRLQYHTEFEELAAQTEAGPGHLASMQPK